LTKAKREAALEISKQLVAEQEKSKQALEALSEKDRVIASINEEILNLRAQLGHAPLNM
jgi:hypothetical protein